MRILFVIGPLKKGGAERVVCNLSNELIKENDVFIATTVTPESDYYLNEKIIIKCLDDEKTSNKNFIIRNYLRAKRLKEVIKNNKIDIAISFLPEPSYRLMMVKNKKLKTIISDRNDPNIEYNSLFQKIITKLLYKKSNGFVFQTEDAKKWFSDKIQERSVVIPNPINKDFICKPYSGQRENVIVTVGRLTEQKNHKLLIDAFINIHKKYKDYKLYIYGEGSLRDELSEIIKSNMLEDSIKLMGNVDNVKESIYKSKMFVLTSDYEGMPNALMEAMALGIPCISTRCPIGGPEFLINNGENGLLIGVGNSEELQGAILKLIEKKDLSEKIGKNANRICDILNPTIINNRWKEYIYSFINKDGR